MRNKGLVFVVTALLAVVLTFALAFVALDSPPMIARLIRHTFTVPDFDPDFEPDRIAEFMDSSQVRPIGYTCLTIVVLLIVLGFIAEKSGLSSAGAILFFLPTVGYFARHMFFLAGLGVLRALWLPFWRDLMKLGDIVYVPHIIVALPLAHAGLRRLAVFPAFLMIGLGFFLFVSAVQAWLYAKLRGRGTVDFWLYRFSRHPQYLGWILWSYGLMLFASQVGVMRADNPGAGLPWVISSLIIICAALAEEVKMQRERGEEYAAYRRATPFMFPLPKSISALIAAPLRLVLKKDRPENRKDLFVTFAVYLSIMMILSAPFLLLDIPGRGGWILWPRVR